MFARFQNERKEQEKKKRDRHSKNYYADTYTTHKLKERELLQLNNDRKMCKTETDDPTKKKKQKICGQKKQQQYARAYTYTHRVTENS